MKYTLDNGKVINIPNRDIDSLKTKYDISESDAIQLWLEDNDYAMSDEYAEALEKTKGYKVDHQASGEKPKKEVKPKTVKVSDTKKMLFSTIWDNIVANFGENAKIEKENKLIFVEIDGKKFKIDLVEQRPPK